jgi:hypothetical protein
MLIKKIFNNRQELLLDMLTKKTMVKDIYGKLWVRSNLSGSKSIQVLDGNGAFFNVPTTSLVDISTKKTFSGNIDLEGCSVNAKTFMYKNKRNSALRFQSSLFNQTAGHDLVKNIHHSLQGLKCVENSLVNSFIVLKPIKGGFAAYSSGVVGFLPKSHGLFFLKRALDFVIEDTLSTRKLNNLGFLDNNYLFKTKYFVLRLPFESGKITIYARYKKNNFSAVAKRKKRNFLNDYNFIFLSQKIEKNSNKIKLLTDAKNKKIFAK